MEQQAKARGRATVVVPATPGNSVVAACIGKVGSGQSQGSFSAISVVIENIPAGSKVELWLASVADSTTGAASDFTNANYFYAGQVCTPARVSYSATGETAVQGSAYWLLAGYPGAQLRIVNGTGLGGSGTISWSAV